MTTYLAKDFASTVEKHRWMNSFIARGKQVFLDDIAVSILVERELEGATVLLSVGTTSEKQGCKKLHLTVSFDHDIVDGGPAVRFIEDLCTEIESGKSIL